MFFKNKAKVKELLIFSEIPHVSNIQPKFWEFCWKWVIFLFPLTFANIPESLLTVIHSFSTQKKKRLLVFYKPKTDGLLQSKAYGLLLLLIVIGTWVVTLPHFTTPPPRKIVLKRLPNWVPYFSSMLSLKVSLKETTIWVGILIIPLKRLKLMFKSLTF